MIDIRSVTKSYPVESGGFTALREVDLRLVGVAPFADHVERAGRAVELAKR